MKSKTALFATLVCGLGCGKIESPKPAPQAKVAPPPVALSTPTERLPKNFENWSPAAQDYWRTKIPAEHKAEWFRDEDEAPTREARHKAWEQEARKELVRPALAGFKPEAVRYKVKVTLTPKATTLHVGENLWYRLELQNIGKKEILFHGSPSFFKIGNEEFRKYNFFMATPDGKTQEVLLRYTFMESANEAGYYSGRGRFAFRPETPLPPGEYDRHCRLFVNLQPGEILVTRPWRYVDIGQASDRMRAGQDPYPLVDGKFRELPLDSKFKFTIPGKYRIWVVYDDREGLGPPKPVDEDWIKQMLQRGDTPEQIEEYIQGETDYVPPAKSNEIRFEVLP